MVPAVLWNPEQTQVDVAAIAVTMLNVALDS